MFSVLLSLIRVRVFFARKKAINKLYTGVLGKISKLINPWYLACLSDVRDPLQDKGKAKKTKFINFVFKARSLATNDSQSFETSIPKGRNLISEPITKWPEDSLIQLEGDNHARPQLFPFLSYVCSYHKVHGDSVSLAKVQHRLLVDCNKIGLYSVVPATHRVHSSGSWLLDPCELDNLERTRMESAWYILCLNGDDNLFRHSLSIYELHCKQWDDPKYVIELALKMGRLGITHSFYREAYRLMQVIKTDYLSAKGLDDFQKAAWKFDVRRIELNARMNIESILDHASIIADFESLANEISARSKQGLSKWKAHHHSAVRSLIRAMFKHIFLCEGIDMACVVTARQVSKWLKVFLEIQDFGNPISNYVDIDTAIRGYISLYYLEGKTTHLIEARALIRQHHAQALKATSQYEHDICREANPAEQMDFRFGLYCEIINSVTFAALMYVEGLHEVDARKSLQSLDAGTQKLDNMPHQERLKHNRQIVFDLRVILNRRKWYVQRLKEYRDALARISLANEGAR